MVDQKWEGYRIARAKFDNQKAPIHTVFKKQYFEAIRNERAELQAKVMREPAIARWEKNFIEKIKSIRHYDEYITILNHRTMELENCFGLAQALGYTEEDERTWNLKRQHFLIHDDHYSLFWALATITNQVLREQMFELKALGPRYVINIPLKKKNGTYVWVKQLCLPLSIDENGMMVRQLNSYTIVSRYEGVSLPLLPRIFCADGSRAKEVEKAVFKKLIDASLFDITKPQKRLMQATLKIWKEAVSEKNKEGENEYSKSDKKRRKPLEFNSIENIVIADRMMQEWPVAHPKITVGTVKNYLTDIKKRLYESFDIKFSSNVEAALFLKNLYYI